MLFLTLLDQSYISPHEYIAVEEEEDLLFITCDTLHPVFTLNDGKLPENSFLFNQSLVIPDINRYKRGIYECRGKTSDSKIFYARTVLKVIGEMIFQCYSINVIMFEMWNSINCLLSSCS